MNVFFISVNTVNPNIFLSCVFFDMLKYIFTDMGRENGFSIFCGENNMQPNSYPAHIKLNIQNNRMRLKPILLLSFNRLLKQTEIDTKSEKEQTTYHLPFTLVNGYKI